jgi:hypothetical protein
VLSAGSEVDWALLSAVAGESSLDSFFADWGDALFGRLWEAT